MYKTKTVAAIIVARMGSSRLKDKMVLPFGEKVIIESVINRVQQCATVDEFVFATTTNPADECLASIAEEKGIRTIRGSEEDVVERMTDAMEALPDRPDVIIRVCSDNPLLMPTVIDDAVQELTDSKADIVTPFEFGTYPFGYGAVAMTTEVLETISAKASRKTHREHVENYCYDHPEEFHIRYQLAPEPECLTNLFLTLDYDLDYHRLCLAEAAMTSIETARQPLALANWVRECRTVLCVDNTSIRKAMLDCFKRMGYTAITSTTPEEAIENNAELIITEAPIDIRRAPSRGAIYPSPIVPGQLMYAHSNLDAPYPFFQYEAPNPPKGAALLEAALIRIITQICAGFPPSLGQRTRFVPPAEKVSSTVRPGFNSIKAALFPPQLCVSTELPTHFKAKLESELALDVAQGCTLTHLPTTLSAENAIFTTLSILDNGDVVPPISGHPALANLSELTIQEIWQSPTMQRLRGTILNGDIISQ